MRAFIHLVLLLTPPLVLSQLLQYGSFNPYYQLQPYYQPQFGQQQYEQQQQYVQYPQQQQPQFYGQQQPQQQPYQQKSLPFDRRSVESPPDVLPNQPPQSAEETKLLEARYSSKERRFGQQHPFSRAAVESGADAVVIQKADTYSSIGGASKDKIVRPYEFYGAAAINGKESDYYPARQAVEALPAGYYLINRQNEAGFSTLTRIAAGESCSQSNEYRRDETNCGTYYQCVHDKWIVFQCAAGLYFNKGVCDFPENVDCKNTEPPPASVTTAEPIKTETATTTVGPPAAAAPITTGWPAEHDYKIVCYFTNWATYRVGEGKYDPDSIDPSLCTHIIYGFAVLDKTSLLLKIFDPWADSGTSEPGSGLKFYERVTELRKLGIKVLIALGGWNDSEGDHYSRLVNNPSARATFVSNAVDFVKKNNFDGLDLDWEYPTCWQTNCKEEHKADKEGFSAWVQELRTAFEPHKLLLSAAVSPSAKIIDLAYDVPVLSKNLDWIAVMTYDFHGEWDKKTGHNAPMYEHPDDVEKSFNTNFSIQHWISRGAEKKKLVLGMPLYGRAFTLDDALNNGLNAPADKAGEAGPSTKQAGFWSYYEICAKIKEGYKVVTDPEGRMGPYAYKDKQWVSYDDVNMLKHKSEYIRKLGLGGGMVWALDLDDFSNRCGQGKYPLLSAIKEVLGPRLSKYPGVTDGSGIALGGSRQGPTNGGNSQDNEVGGGSNDYKVVCYFTNWATYRPGIGKYEPENIDESLCTHIVYGFAVLDAETMLMKPHDSWVDIDKNFYQKVTAMKSKGRKVLLALGGWNDSAGDKYSKLVSNPSSRKAFIDHAIEFIKKHNFDGLDLDWEYPKCWQVECNKGPLSDKANFAAWIRELKEALSPSGLLLTAAVSPSKMVIDEGYDVEAAEKNFDYVSVMTYDYHGQWDKKTGHIAPMYHHPMNSNEFFNVNFTINYWISKGLSKKKIIVGMPMYGQSFTLADTANNGLGAASLGGGTAGEFTRASGFLAYHEICDMIKNHGWKVVRDPESRMGPYAYKGNEWVSFDDVNMIREKTQYVKQMGLGGAMIWALDLDDFTKRCGCESYPLLKTINRGLGRLDGSGGIDPKCELGGAYRVQERTGAFVAEVTLAPYSKCDAGSFRKSEKTCSKFFICDEGHYLERECPEGLFWNNRSMCDWPSNANCKVEEGEQHQQQQESKPVVSPPATAVVTRDDTAGFKVVCYFTNWAIYRQGKGKYLAEDIDPSLCTHINYGFAVLDSTTMLMKPHDTWADLEEWNKNGQLYKKLVALKEKGIKVLLALGGWNDSEGDKYSRLVSNPAARANFIQHAVEFIETHGFDGLDLDWEYPKCWQVDCSKGPESDKANFALLVEELSAVFRPKKLLLTAAVSPSKTVIDAAYDVPKLSQYLDLINVMCYDYHGEWDKKTGHIAPLKDYDGSNGDNLNAEFTMNYWREKGADPKKLVMGMPTYGRAFTLADPKMTGINAPAPSAGMQGDFTRAAGFLAYYEICDKLKEGWTLVHHDKEAMGPYIFRDNQWVGYDDVAMIRKKSEFVKTNGYGGGMIWALDLDDFSNSCGCEKYPLLKTINRVLRDQPLPEKDCNDDNKVSFKSGLTKPLYTPQMLPYATFYQRPQQLNPVFLSKYSMPHNPAGNNNYGAQKSPLSAAYSYNVLLK